MRYEVEHTHTGAISGGLGLGTMGFITWLVFLILKVTGVWAISWFWVFFPLWIPWAIAGGIFVLVLIIAIIVACVQARHG